MNRSQINAAVPLPLSSAFKQRLSLDHIWITSVVLLIWLFISVLPLPPNDLWWHMAAGRIMVNEGQLLHTNRWAYTLPTEAPYVYQSWLSELLMYGLWRLGDVPLLTLARTAAIGVSYGVIAWHALRRANNGIVVVIVLFLAAIIGWNNWTLRPQTLALVPGAIFVTALGEYIGGRVSARWLAVLPLSMLVWVNMHGSFMLGAGLFACAWLDVAIGVLRGSAIGRVPAWRLRDLTLAGTATLLAMLLNPLGPGIFGYVRSMLTNPALQRWFIEWQPPSNNLARDFTGFWFFVMLLALAVLLARGPRRPSATDLLWYCGLAWLTISGVRYAMWFALLLTPLMAERLAAVLPRRTSVTPPYAFTVGYWLLVCALVIWVLPWFEPGRYLGPQAEHLFASSGSYRMLLGDTTPVAATEWLSQHPQQGRFWTDMTYTSYTIWQLPETQVFADLRVELFPEEIWLDYFDISRGDQKSLALLDRWQISHLMLSLGWQERLHTLLAHTPGWCEVYKDTEAAIFSRCVP
jgi:hypothetical protein